MTEPKTDLAQLNERSRAILRRIVDVYLETGEPVGSRNLSRALPMSLSPASIRNVMADLEAAGLIYAPHTSAGRLPTQLGLRLFVDGLIEIGGLSADERRQLDTRIASNTSQPFDQLLLKASEMISGLSACAGVVLADKQVARLKHIEFVPLEATRALVVLVGEDSSVENRVISVPPGLPPSALVEASNYLNRHVRGMTIGQAQAHIEAELTSAKAELDVLAQKVVKAGLAEWSGGAVEAKSLIVRGQANLLKGLSDDQDLERIRQLFEDLEQKKDLVQLLGLSDQAEGVRIFIGSENKLFSMSGSSLIVAPFKDGQRNVVGVLGVIGPTRLNYARIIPMVDYTAKLVGRLLT